MGYACGVACRLVTNHAVALAHLARDPEIRLRELAEALGITERATHRIVCDLEEHGYITRHREGRSNTYDVHLDRPLEAALAEGRTVGELVELLAPERRLVG
jgi:DNA-binding IclR family transcriptional regulator